VRDLSLEIRKGVQLVDGSNANAYFVEDSDGSLILIDAGIQPNGKKILDYLATKMSRKPSDVKTLVLTHCHPDHIRGAAAIKRTTGSKVEVHELDADYVSGKSKYPSPGGAVGVMFSILSPFFRVSPVEPDVRLKDGDAAGRLTVIHSPGHTPGSISLYDKDRKILFVGDTARFLKGKLEGPPPQFTPDMAGAKRSMEKLSKLDFDVLLSGHGEPLDSKDAPKMLAELAAQP
jgi:hydroxyacylglutathione hydrolase